MKVNVKQFNYVINYWCGTLNSQAQKKKIVRYPVKAKTNLAYFPAEVYEMPQLNWLP